MRRALKAVVGIAFIAAASFALFRWVALPYRCNVRAKQGTIRLLTAASLPDRSMRAARLCRVNVEQLQPCVDRSRSNIAAAMVLAGSQRFLGRPGEAAQLYERALSYDRRPELYFNLGQAQIESGQTQAGIQNLITACIYDQRFFDEISQEQPEVRSAVRAYLESHARRQPQP